MAEKAWYDRTYSTTFRRELIVPEGLCVAVENIAIGEVDVDAIIEELKKLPNTKDVYMVEQQTYNDMYEKQYSLTFHPKKVKKPKKPKRISEEELDKIFARLFKRVLKEVGYISVGNAMMVIDGDIDLTKREKQAVMQYSEDKDLDWLNLRND